MDPCDRCGKRAYMAFWKADGRSEMTFCKHHGEQQRPVLEFYGYRLVRDDRKLLDPQHVTA